MRVWNFILNSRKTHLTEICILNFGFVWLHLIVDHCATIISQQPSPNLAISNHPQNNRTRREAPGERERKREKEREREREWALSALDSRRTLLYKHDNLKRITVWQLIKLSLVARFRIARVQRVKINCVQDQSEKTTALH